MSSQSKPEVIFINQPTEYRPRGKNLLLEGRYDHIKGTGTTKFPKIHIKNACRELFLFVEPVYAGKKTLLHHHRLVRLDQLKENLQLTANLDPLCYKLDEGNNYTTDLQIGVMPPGDEHQRPGVVKLKKGDLNDKKMVLSCKVYPSYENGKNGENLIATKYSNPLENKSQRLEDLKLVGEGSVDGGTVIELPFSGDNLNTSYKVRFTNKRFKFIAYGEIINTRTCSKWLSVRTPPYILENKTEPERLTDSVKISVHVVRVHDGKLSKEFHFQYTAREIESSAGTSQDEIITIKDMLSMQDDDNMNIWIICSPISLPEEYVKTNLAVRFSEKNNEYTDVKIKEFDPKVNRGLIILETSFNFCEKFGKNATIQINNTLCNTLSEKFEMKFPKLKEEKTIKKRSAPYNEPLPGGTKKLKISENTASTSTDLTNQFQNDPNQQEQSAHNQPITNTSSDNCGEILVDLIEEYYFNDPSLSAINDLESILDESELCRLITL